MGKQEKEPETVREANQGICIKCRRLLPADMFMREVTGCLTAWCNLCRTTVASNWGVDADQVEIVHCLYTFEKFLAREAETVTLAKINMDRALPAELAALKGRIHIHQMIRHDRIRERVRHLLADHRAAFYQAINMDAPDLSQVFPAAAGAV